LLFAFGVSERSSLLIIIAGSVQMLRNSGDKALIIREAVNMMTTLSEMISYSQMSLLWLPTAHLDEDQDLAKMAVDAYAPNPDNVIGEKEIE